MSTLGDWTAIDVISVALVTKNDQTLEDLGIEHIEEGQTIIKCADVAPNAKIEKDYRRAVEIKNDWRNRAEAAEAKVEAYERVFREFYHEPFGNIGGSEMLLIMLREAGWESE